MQSLSFSWFPSFALLSSLRLVPFPLPLLHKTHAETLLWHTEASLVLCSDSVAVIHPDGSSMTILSASKKFNCPSWKLPCAWTAHAKPDTAILFQSIALRRQSNKPWDPFARRLLAVLSSLLFLHVSLHLQSQNNQLISYWP